MNDIQRRPDQTFSPECLFGSARWVCMTLGIGYETFRKGRRSELEADGLPAPDPILNLWLKTDVIAWVESRRNRVLFAPARAAPRPDHGYAADDGGEWGRVTE